MASEKPGKLSSAVVGMLIFASALAVINFASTNVLADEDHYTDWIITNYQWRENTTITLHECNLIIQNGGTLVFNNSVTLSIINPAPPTRYGIVIDAGGQFIVNSSTGNTKIISGSIPVTRTYPFLNSGTIDFLGATVERVYGDPSYKTSTGGIRNLPGSNCTLENCNIVNGDTHGIYVEGNSTKSVGLTIKNTEIVNTTSNNYIQFPGIWNLSSKLI
jgi:hypothetical protein